MSSPGASVDALLDTAPCGFVSFGDDGVVERVNATLLQMLGYDREEVVGRHVEGILSVGSRIFYQTHWFPLLRLHGRAEEIFLMLRTRSGDDLGVLANAARREGSEGTAYDCVMIRVRERQKYEAELLRARRAAEEANRAKSTFLTMMSHELRTPLNAIAGYVEILEMGIHGPVTDAQREMLAKITRSERHLLRLINEVLNLGRIEAGHVDYRIESVPIAEIVAAVAPMVEPQLEKKEIVLSIDVPFDVRVSADREKVQQIVLNLLSNAAKFTSSGGRVTVDLGGGPPGPVRLRVSDTGVGIPEDQQELVFQPFIQVDVSHARRAEGSGLGLAISRDLARGMGGDLVLQSDPGRGSTFTLILPRASGEAVPTG